MKRYFFNLCLMVCFYSTSLIANDCMIQEAKRLLVEEAVFLNSKLKVQIFGCGGLFYETIDALELTIIMPTKIDLAKARLVFIAALQDWINRTNHDTAAKPYYKTYPMTINNFELRMLLPDYDVRSDIKHPRIALIFTVADQIIYCYRDENGSLKPFRRESYHDAVKKVNDRFNTQEEKKANKTRYTKMYSKNGILARRRPKIKLGFAGAEIAQLEQVERCRQVKV